MFCAEANAPAAALRLLLSRIRRQVSPALLLTADNTVQFDANAAWVDYHDFTQALASNLTTQETEAIATAISLYRGEFLEGLTLADAPEFELWLLGQRAHARQLYENGLQELIRRHIRQHHYPEALQCAQQLLQSNPLLEEAHAHLMWLYAQTGQREAALAQYAKCHDILQQELAVEPTPELQALYEEVKADHLDSTYQISSPSPAPSTQQSTTDFVGRQAELAYLQAAWEAVNREQGVVVLLEASAGGGKTRLVETFSQGLAVLTVRCYESTSVLPYQPWLGLLEAHLQQWPKAALRQLPAATTMYLARLMPELARRLQLDPSTASHTPGEMERLFMAVFDFLSQMPDGQKQPRLLFIDDLQWADETSLRLFQFSAQRVAHLPLLLIGTFRSEEIGPALESILADLNRQGVTRLELSPLTPMEVEQLITRDRPQLSPDDRNRVIDVLTEATGGNALFVTSVLSELVYHDTIPDTLPVPATVRDLIRRRLRQLPAGGQQVVEAMGVLATSVTLTDAQQISGRSEEETALAIEQGLDWQLLQMQIGDQGLRYDFHHDLVRQAVVEQLSPVRRELLHRRSARWLEQTGASSALLTYHWGMAHDQVKERHYAALAGQEAATVYAHAEAISYLGRALALTPNEDWAGQYKLLLLRESEYALQGLWEAQAQDLARLQHLAEMLGDEQRQITVALRQAEFYRNTSRFAESITTAHLAVQLAESIQDIMQQARGYLQWGLTLWRRGDNEAAQRYLGRASQLSKKAGLRDEEARSDLVLSGIYRAWGDFDRAIACMQHALRLSRESGHWQNEATALNNLGVIATDQGDYSSADTYYQQALKIYRKTGDRSNQGMILGNHGGVFIDLGDYVTAEAKLTEASQIFSEINDRRAQSFQLSDLSLLAHYRGDNETALVYGQQALELTTAVDEWPGRANAWIKLGHAQLGLGHLSEAAEAYQQALNIERRLEQFTLAMEALAGLARVALAQQDLSQAQAHVREVLAYLESNTLEGAWEPFRVYLTCYQVLQAGQDPHAHALLETAYDLLQARAAKINDGAARRSFLENVSFHRDIVRAFEKNVD